MTVCYGQGEDREDKPSLVKKALSLGCCLKGTFKEGKRPSQDTSWITSITHRWPYSLKEKGSRCGSLCLRPEHSPHDALHLRV
jgi:hypothetical protein